MTMTFAQPMPAPTENACTLLSVATTTMIAPPMLAQR